MKSPGLLHNPAPKGPEMKLSIKDYTGLQQKRQCLVIFLGEVNRLYYFQFPLCSYSLPLSLRSVKDLSYLKNEPSRCDFQKSVITLNVTDKLITACL
jgi:hypothetical protein